jgi:hypothetical protein
MPMIPHVSARRRLASGLAFGLSLALLILPCRPTSGQPRPPAGQAARRVNPPQPAAKPGAAGPWSARFARIDDDIRKGKPLVTFVLVPLCSNDQIDCGSTAAGRPGNLNTNIYWGAVFGIRRFFERKSSAWTRVELTQGADQGFRSPEGKPLDHVPPGVLLERAVYVRKADPGDATGKRAASGEQIVVLQAVHGAQIDHAISLFWSLATAGGRVRFQDGQRIRDERVHVAGYAGHNRLMDGIKLPAPPGARKVAEPIPSFVMACASDAYFSDSLRQAGSEPLVMTRSLMAPEGYVIDGIAQALGDNAALPDVRDRAVQAYANWQRLSNGVASTIFAPSR